MTHYDCKYYLAVDVFKGICKRDKNKINVDDNSCENFSQASKCKNCSNFTPAENNLGLCMNLYDAYPEMNASTCIHYSRGIA